MEIFENFRIWRLKLRKQLFCSEYVFKIEYIINVKRVEGDETLDNITTYQGNVQHVKIIFKMAKSLKNEPSKHVN